MEANVLQYKENIKIAEINGTATLLPEPKQTEAFDMIGQGRDHHFDSGPTSEGNKMGKKESEKENLF